MTTVFLDAVFKPFLKIVHDTGQQLTFDRTNFLTNGFLQIIQRMGFVSANTRFQIPLKKKNHTLKDQESEGATARLRNGKWGAWGNMFPTMVIDSFAVCVVAPSCWNHTLAQSPPPAMAYLLSTTHSKDVRFPWVTLYFISHKIAPTIFSILL